METRILCLFLIVCSCLAQAKTPRQERIEIHWRAVSHTSEQPVYHAPSLKVSAEQAELETHKQLAEKINKFGYPVWYGCSGPVNVHTRNLSFRYKGIVYSIPQRFVSDLLDLHIHTSVSRPSLISIHGSDVVFTMTGCDGEKAYTVHFHFREGAFFQRFLAASEGTFMVFRTKDE